MRFLLSTIFEVILITRTIGMAGELHKSIEIHFFSLKNKIYAPGSNDLSHSDAKYYVNFRNASWVYSFYI